MEGRGITDDDLAKNPGTVRKVYHAPPDSENILDAEVLLGDYEGTPVLKIPWIVTEQEKDIINNGGTVWLTIIGAGMPPVLITAEE